MAILYINYQISWSRTFQNQLSNILFYIDSTLQNPISSKEFYPKIINSLENIKIFPRLYPKIKSKKYLEKELRKLVIDKYVIIYEVDDLHEKINLLHIFHSSQNYLNLL